MNFNHEYLQDIIIQTANKSILSLDVGKQNETYRLYGKFYDSARGSWALVDFSSDRRQDKIQLLEECLNNFNETMKDRNDKISSVSNPCNTPFISKDEQEALLAKLSISAKVTVN